MGTYRQAGSSHLYLKDLERKGGTGRGEEGEEEGEGRALHFPECIITEETKHVGRAGHALACTISKS